MKFDSKKLAGLLKTRDITVAEFAEKYDLAKGTVYNILKGGTISKRDAAMFAYALNIQVSYFAAEKEELRYPGNNSLDTRVNLISYSSDFKMEGRSYLDFLNAYYEALIGVVERAKNELFVLDYLANNFQTLRRTNKNYDRTDHDDPYHKFHSLYKKYLNAINKKIASTNGDFTYTRVYQIPLKSQEEARDSEEGNFDNRKKFVLRQVYRNTIAHYEYLSQYLKYIDFKVYILTNPIRSYSYLFTDQGEIASEYYKIDKSGGFYPDMLFLNNGYTGQKMISTYRHQFDRLLEKTNALIEIKREDSERLLREINDELQEESKKREEELKKFVVHNNVADYSNATEFNDLKIANEIEYDQARNAKAKFNHIKSSPEEIKAYFEKD